MTALDIVSCDVSKCQCVAREAHFRPPAVASASHFGLLEARFSTALPSLSAYEINSLHDRFQVQTYLETANSMEMRDLILNPSLLPHGYPRSSTIWVF
jgi:hypothetical protein